MRGCVTCSVPAGPHATALSARRPPSPVRMRPDAGGPHRPRAAGRQGGGRVDPRPNGVFNGPLLSDSSCGWRPAPGANWSASTLRSSPMPSGRLRPRPCCGMDGTARPPTPPDEGRNGPKKRSIVESAVSSARLQRREPALVAVAATLHQLEVVSQRNRRRFPARAPACS